MTSTVLSKWHTAEHHSATGNLDAAKIFYADLSVVPEWKCIAYLRLSMVAQLQGKLEEAVQMLLASVAAKPDEDQLAVDVLRQAFDLGEINAGLTVASLSILSESQNPEVLLAAAQYLCDQSFGNYALPFLESAASLGARSAKLFYLLGVARLFSGDIRAAAASFQQCLIIQPDDALAHYMLSSISRQIKNSTHLRGLRNSYRKINLNHPSAPLIFYALFNELEVMGEFDEAWEMLSKGMQARRAQINYNEESECTLFENLEKVWPSRSDAEEPLLGPSPIFILGLPRSGTTLLERILGGHSKITDAGELRDFLWQARIQCNCTGDMDLDSRLVQALSSFAGWADLGREYLNHTQWRAQGRQFFTDKLPTNYLNLGWIAKALPNAKFIHMTRDPREVCFSNIKQLFAPRNAHSFDLLEMANHYVRYRKLMRHWHEAFPGRILDVAYENLVGMPDKTASMVLSFCGLDWEPDLSAVESRTSEVATASMAQVREAIHSRYVGQWQRYAEPLKPMLWRLSEAGY